MPELPEVEVIRKQLSLKLPATLIEQTLSPQVGSLTRKSPQNPSLNLLNQTLWQIRRHGKVLIFEFSNTPGQVDCVVLNGLGMSGGWRISPTPLIEPHVHLSWRMQGLADGKTIYLSYKDPRRFGMLGFLTKAEADLKLKSLGVDVGSKDFNTTYLKSIFKRYPERPIKSFLLEQKFFAGIGNYIACEICARSGIRPHRKLKHIKPTEYKKIIKATKSVLWGSENLGGLTFSGGYQDTTGSNGGGLAHLFVFHQKICQNCKKTRVKKCVMAQRGTFYCPHCQK